MSWTTTHDAYSCQVAVAIATNIQNCLYRVAVFAVQLNCRKGVDLDSCDVIGGDVNLRHDDVIAVGVDVSKTVPDWSKSLTVHAPRSICTQTACQSSSIYLKPFRVQRQLYTATSKARGYVAYVFYFLKDTYVC